MLALSEQTGGHLSRALRQEDGRAASVISDAVGAPAHRPPRYVNFLRRLALPRSVKHWSLTKLLEKLIKIGAKVVAHSRYVIFQMSEVAVPRELFVAILERIQQFGVPPPLVQRA